MTPVVFTCASSLRSPWECGSREEAIEWLKRAPFEGGDEIELRPIVDLDDVEAFADGSRRVLLLDTYEVAARGGTQGIGRPSAPARSQLLPTGCQVRRLP